MEASVKTICPEEEPENLEGVTLRSTRKGFIIMAIPSGKA